MHRILLLLTGYSSVNKILIDTLFQSPSIIDLFPNKLSVRAKVHVFKSDACRIIK